MKFRWKRRVEPKLKQRWSKKSRRYVYYKGYDCYRRFLPEFDCIWDNPYVENELTLKDYFEVIADQKHYMAEMREYSYRRKLKKPIPVEYPFTEGY